MRANLTIVRPMHERFPFRRVLSIFVPSNTGKNSDFPSIFVCGTLCLAGLTAHVEKTLRWTNGHFSNIFVLYLA